MKIISIDPGKNVGVIMAEVTNGKLMIEKSDHFESYDFFKFLDSISRDVRLIIVESFVMSTRSKAETHALEQIGALKYYAYKKLNLILQSSSSQRSVKKLMEGEPDFPTNRHEVSAYKHLLFWYRRTST